MEKENNEKEKLIDYKKGKDEKYNDTNTNPFTGEKQTWSTKQICGIEAKPHLYFQSKSILHNCEFCNHLGITSVQTTWNISNYLFCYFCTCCFAFKQLLQGKDKRLQNAVHKCVKCDKVVGIYDPC